MSRFATCLWFDHQAKDAVDFYRGIFKNVEVKTQAFYSEAGARVSGQKEGSLMTVEFQLENQNIIGLNGGPLFKFTPAMSFFVSCSTPQEISEMWKKLSAGGTVRMGLDKYPWADQYGWTADKFGVEWQLILSPRGHKVVPSFLFVDALFGKGEEAIKHYTSIFSNSKIISMARDEKSKTVAHCSFELDGEGFALMEGEGKHGHKFNESFSIVVNCESQKEIDYYWDAFIKAGGTESQCGWLKDKFGVSWQITHREIGQIMSDPKKANRAMAAMIKMKKLDIQTIKNA